MAIRRGPRSGCTSSSRDGGPDAKQIKRERTASALAAFNTDFSLVRRDDVLYQTQAESSALHRLCQRSATIELFKYLLLIARRDAHAMIPDANADSTI